MGLSYRFDRYRRGQKMAEGILIENADSLEQATAKAATLLASDYPRSDVLVFDGTNALRAEHDEAFDKGKQAFEFQQRAEKEVAELRLERDTLAAQLDAVFGAVLRPFVETCSDTEAMAEARRIAMSDPQDILARRDAKVKAEAMEDLSQQLSLNAENARVNQYHWSADAMQDASDEALQEAMKCRQQAEGGGDE